MCQEQDLRECLTSTLSNSVIKKYEFVIESEMKIKNIYTYLYGGKRKTFSSVWLKNKETNNADYDHVKLSTFYLSKNSNLWFVDLCEVILIVSEPNSFISLIFS